MNPTIFKFVVAISLLGTMNFSFANGVPSSVSTQVEELGVRTYRLNLTALGGDNDGSVQAWRESAQDLCRNPDWLGVPTDPVSFLSPTRSASKSSATKAALVTRTLTGVVFCLTGFSDSREQGSDAQFKQLIEMPLSEFNLPINTTLYSMLRDEKYQLLLTTLEGLFEKYRNGELEESTIKALYSQILLNDPNQIVKLEKLVSQYPDSAVGYLLLAMSNRDLAWDFRGSGFSMNVVEDDFQIFKEKMKLAKDYIDKAREIDPMLPLVWAKTIDIYKGIGTSEAYLAIPIFRESLEYQPGSVETHFSFFHYSLPKWHGSEDILKWLIEDTKSRYAINQDLIVLEALYIDYEGWKLSQRGLHEKAREKYQEAIEVYSHPAIVSSQISTAFRFGELELAQQYITESLERNPGSSGLYGNLRYIAVEQKNYFDAAKFAYAEALLDKQVTEPLYLRVRIFMAYRRYNDALAELNELLKRDTENSLAIQQLIAEVNYQKSIRDESL
ncbi:hypothetical protein QWZ13_17700 [Reinekea marina]|uniref:Tetratricopeptide repeat protein n=1 Tax=Reinekea marina TaxID=1310421 RepID=A0ABV7WLS7_9GAMM|nr:hypothetical protein [Reinekea marina]MDN3650745.1 hypothetical protein [Reinekea marina]